MDHSNSSQSFVHESFMMVCPGFNFDYTLNLLPKINFLIFPKWKFLENSVLIKALNEVRLRSAWFELGYTRLDFKEQYLDINHIL